MSGLENKRDYPADARNVIEHIEEIEKMRESYDPRSEGIEIKILFIGESPPKDAPVNFFYNRTSVLYYATFLAFHLRFGVLERDFLEFFKNSGCYLYDLFEVPGMVVRENKRWRGVVRASEYEIKKARCRLEEFVLSEKPEIVIVVIKRVFKEIEDILKKLKERGIIREYFALPFPRDAHSFTKYVKKLYSILEVYDCAGL
ncbi:MAG: hypothetical protein J7L38_00385 [Thermoproteales archaeon]|nr:hypothetical protein [Thermoproteales archaeon]